MQLANICTYRKCPYTGHRCSTSERLIFIQKIRYPSPAWPIGPVGASYLAAKCAEHRTNGSAKSHGSGEALISVIINFYP